MRRRCGRLRVMGSRTRLPPRTACEWAGAWPGSAPVNVLRRFSTNLPPDYLRISSGLGDAPPTQAIVWPILSREKVLGVLEFASFREFKHDEEALIEELLPAVAMSLEVLSHNLATHELLTQTQAQARQLEIQNEAANRQRALRCHVFRRGHGPGAIARFPEHDAAVRGSHSAGRRLRVRAHLDDRTRHGNAGAVRERGAVHQPGGFARSGEGGRAEAGADCARRASRWKRTRSRATRGLMSPGRKNRAWCPLPGIRWWSRTSWWV